MFCGAFDKTVKRAICGSAVFLTDILQLEWRLGLYPTSGSVDLAVVHRLLPLSSIVFLLAPAAKKARNISRASGWACPDFWQIFGKFVF
jgi:hypothetical protein